MINSVLRAFRLLELYSSAEPLLTLAEIASRLDAPKSTVHNLLNTLVHVGYVEKTGEGRYALGPAVVTLTQAVRVNVELRDRAAPLLRELANICQESVYLTAWDGSEVLYIYAVESPHRLLARTAVGDRLGPHYTSVGKAVLSRLPWDEVERIIEHTGLPVFTPNTIGTLEELRRDWEQTRERGFSIDDEEHELGIYCVGAAILDSSAQVVGSCSVSGNDKETIVGFGQRVAQTAQDVSRRMGYVAQRSSTVLDCSAAETSKGTRYNDKL